ncbi:MAG: hypothetical protein Pars92KO_32580 [Parasphingorhabdus sp.]
MKLKKLFIASLCAPFLTSMAMAQDKASKDDTEFQALFTEWADDPVVDKNDWNEFTPVDDNEWLTVVTGANGAIHMIRAKDLNNLKNMAPRVWIKTDHSKNKTVDYRSMMELVRFDCAADKYTVLSQTSHMPDGTVGHRWKGHDTDFITPETVADAWAQAVCPSAIRD